MAAALWVPVLVLRNAMKCLCLAGVFGPSHVEKLTSCVWTRFVRGATGNGALAAQCWLGSRWQLWFIGVLLQQTGLSDLLDLCKAGS